MDIQIDRKQNTIKLTATLDELETIQHLDQAVYGTPDTGMEVITQTYVASRPSWTYDRAIATVDDFLQEAGYDCIAFDGEDDPSREEDVIITISRMIIEEEEIHA